MDRFKRFFAEEKKPYRILVLSYDDFANDDPNVTGERIISEAKSLGFDAYTLKLDGGYISTTSGKKVAHTYNRKKKKIDEKGFELNPDDTLVFIRGSITTRYAWLDTVTQLERAGFCCINSRHCFEVCHDKYRTMLFLAEAGLRQPKTVLIAHKNESTKAFEELDSNYPIILKTVTGSHGVGVLFIESEKNLVATVQLLYKLDEDISLLLQEYIPTKSDVRAIVRDREIIATMSRPVVEGDFRSNVSQGANPTSIKLTDMEKINCLDAAKVVDGLWVGVDFIPAKDRVKEQPFIIEVNSSPGSAGIEKTNKTNMVKDVVEYYMDRTKWLKPKPFRSIYS